MSVPPTDHTGKRFGRLVALKVHDRRNLHVRWKCRCDCGRTKVVRAASLVRGQTRSCGCLQKELSRAQRHSVTHGDSHRGMRRLYGAWCTMKGRKDVPVCGEWNDYAAFKKWALASGYKPHLELWRDDRSGPYSPDNCRWITALERNNTHPHNVVIEHAGAQMTVAEWAREMGMEAATLKQRLYKGWPIEKALTAPVRRHKEYAPRQAATD